ncbi:MAG: hypothetical protein AAFY56_05500, partial [Pseudomonadota bacterium]
MAQIRNSDIMVPDPYPIDWSDLSEFRYTDRLVLFREAEAISIPGMEDPNYIVFEDYTSSLKVDGTVVTITVPAGLMTDLATVPGMLIASASR